MIHLKSRQRTQTMMRRPTRLKQNARSPPSAPVAIESARYIVTVSRKRPRFCSHSALGVGGSGGGGGGGGGEAEAEAAAGTAAGAAAAAIRGQAAGSLASPLAG